MNRFPKYLLLAAATFAASSAAKADIIIDDFATPTSAINYQIGSTTANGTTFTNTGILPGLDRSITLNVTSPSTPDSNSLSGVIGGGLFTMSFNINSSGTGVANYTYSTAQNFTPTGVLGALRFSSAADAGFGTNVPLNFTIFTTTGNLTATSALSLMPGFTNTDVALSSFTGTGDLTHVTGLSFTITAGQAADVAIDSLSVTTPEPPPPDVLPAPPAALLALLAMPALGLRHRRNKKALEMA